MLPLLANVKKNNEFPRGLALEVLGFKAPLMTLSFFLMYISYPVVAQSWCGVVIFRHNRNFLKLTAKPRVKNYAEALKR